MKKCFFRETRFLPLELLHWPILTRALWTVQQFEDPSCSAVRQCQLNVDTFNYNQKLQSSFCWLFDIICRLNPQRCEPLRGAASVPYSILKRWCTITVVSNRSKVCIKKLHQWESHVQDKISCKSQSLLYRSSIQCSYLHIWFFCKKKLFKFLQPWVTAPSVLPLLLTLHNC